MPLCHHTTIDKIKIFKKIFALIFGLHASWIVTLKGNADEQSRKRGSPLKRRKHGLKHNQPQSSNHMLAMTTLIDIPGREQYRQRFLRDGFVVIENGKHAEQLVHQREAIVHTKMVAYKEAR